jgi:hypothetical protein
MWQVLRSISRTCGEAIRKLAFGDTLLPQEFTIGLADPQTEISVWLHGLPAPLDVTNRHTTACTAPLTICIAFHNGPSLNEIRSRKLVLRFREQAGNSVLGEIHLQYNEAISIGDSMFVLFRIRNSANYCLPRIRLWANYLAQAYSRWRRSDPPDMRMPLAEELAAMVTFIRPHPLCLVSVGNQTSGNIFPMNLMGDLGGGYLGFGLREMRMASHVVERAGRIAISNVPILRSSLPFQLAPNHKKESIDWTMLPFQTRPTAEFGIPAPVFASRIRECEIQRVHPIGSHRFLIARIASDNTYARDLQVCIVHGFYQFWRLGGDKAKLIASLSQDSLNKRGPGC